MTDDSPTLHIVYDPLCGWCYAAGPLIQAARRVPGLTLALHGGGMLTGANRRPISTAWRDYVMPHDRRIAQLTGQTFGGAYFDGLLRENGVLLDSAPPTTAILAADAMAGRGLDMLERVQQAHYVEGRRIADPSVLTALAQDLGLDIETFAATYAALEGAHTQAHMEQSRQWLHQWRGRGFPTLALQIGGRVQILDIGAWLGRADDWQQHLVERLDRAGASASASAAAGPLAQASQPPAHADGAACAVPSGAGGLPAC